MWEKWLEDLDLRLPEKPVEEPQNREELFPSRIWETARQLPPFDAQEREEILQCLQEVMHLVAPQLSYNFVFARITWEAVVHAFRLGVAFQRVKQSKDKG